MRFHLLAECTDACFSGRLLDGHLQVEVQLVQESSFAQFPVARQRRVCKIEVVPQMGEQVVRLPLLGGVQGRNLRKWKFLGHTDGIAVLHLRRPGLSAGRTA